jgi:hypothetical protein
VAGPRVAVEDVAGPTPDPFRIDFERAGSEVVLSSPKQLSEDLVSRLQRELPVFPLRRRRLWAAAVDIQEAQVLADRARVELPTGTQVRLRPLTSRRRWWRKQQLLGSYASEGTSGNG